ncbi:nucleoside 2-deoxyribosyltransferase [Mitsuokella sp.]|uniref:nucleoside 2-deoxyribosyltransferase n=1 Tax=Mitsuokella TaxID=52225 RepID=UPI0029E593F3|nr:nucleoside 2-deoxyribosyltransferase [Mitsuokella sp.]MDD6382207.1 nucleoside 2-deoxyribosyltransferase [Selenomonadaceae bacterium]MDY4474025.1 nucleoside 2-deoxyribosyltransferase [Mitsuokella sp.]
MSKNIYFAGSIRGGRQDAALYQKIIAFLQQKDRVLTEHVGNLSLNIHEQGQEDQAIYEQDTAWLRTADLVIAECTRPSLGVGYELAYAERFKIPCHIFYRPAETALSAMLTGDSYFHIHPYTDWHDLQTQLATIMQRQ